MTEIVPKQLWIGSAVEVRQISRVLDAGVEALVDLALEERPPSVTRDVVYCRFPLNDGRGNPPKLHRAADDAGVSLLEKRVTTLGYCGGGMSRSPEIVAAALAASRGGSFDKTLAGITAGRPHDVSPGFWVDVKRVCGG